ncbi:MAG: PucR family transcriptional regulator [Bacillota bacterium]
MINMMEILASIKNAIGKNIIFVNGDEQVSFPVNISLDIGLKQIIQHCNTCYQGYNIYPVSSAGDDVFICIEAEKFEMNDTIRLILNVIEIEMRRTIASSDHIEGILNGRLKDEDIHILQNKYEGVFEGRFVLIQYFNEDKASVLEIVRNSIECQWVYVYGDNILLVTNETDVKEVCIGVAQNILGELLSESTIVIGNMIGSLKDLRKAYESCQDAMQWKQAYKITESVMEYDRLDLYRVISNIDEDIKKVLIEKIFHAEFCEALDHDMEMTIEGLFKNNLNITDTARYLYVHRNTLLYRIEKIYKLTGYDLRKFEDSLRFRLAWLIKKEKVFIEKKS